MHAIRRHLTFANIVAVLALIVAMTGTAYAGGLITSKQIKNGTIKNADIHSGTIKAGKLDSSAQVQAFYTLDSGQNTGLSLSDVTAASLAISAPGSYVITATTVITNLDTTGADVTCTLTAGGSQDHSSNFLEPLGNGSYSATFAMTVTQMFTDSSGSASVTCAANAAVGVAIGDTTITAIKVESVGP